MLSKSPCLKLSVRVMFRTMRLLAPAATRPAQFGRGGLGPFRRVRKNRDIVNFMNFTSRQSLRIRGGAAV